MQLTFLGGANEIGASCAVLDTFDARILIDCGQRLGVPTGNALPDFSVLEYGPPVDAVLLTHAHTDHIGGLPAILPFLPPECPIYGTEPTLAIAKVMLEDSRRIMAQYRTGDGELPLFPPGSVAATYDRFRSVRWGKSLELPASDLKATWFPSGHILGAGMIEVKNGKEESVLFSGDLSVADQLTVPGVFVPSIRPDVLVLESTYGDRLHPHRPDQEARIVERVRQTIENGGHVLFPTFALGRAQEVLLILGRAIREGQLGRVPVFADGLVRAIAKVYSSFPEELGPVCRRTWEHGLDPIFPDDLPIKAVRTQKQRESIAGGDPCVVVASSGMLQGGPSQFFASRWLDRPENCIVVTGYQDEESPGQALLDLAQLEPDQPRYFWMSGVRVEVHCQVDNCQLSAHADGNELTSIASKLDSPRILLVHGDDGARQSLARTLLAHTRSDVEIPQNGDRVEIEHNARPREKTRLDPLALWPPWDPREARELDLEKFHTWLAALDPPLKWVTVEELAELWKSPEPVTKADLQELRTRVFRTEQPYFVPDSRRPFLLRITHPENLIAPQAQIRSSVEHATKLVRELFPKESGLVRFGFFPDEGVIEFRFRFPQAARENYVARFRDLEHRTGWHHRFSESTADEDLRDLARALLHEAEVLDAAVTVDHDERRVRATGSANSLGDQWSQLADRFRQQTGYILEPA